jgi:hypothetical protein
MSLNLMLTDRSAVYLSGDFRLTYNLGGNWRDDLQVQKLVPVLKFRWGALVSFAGVAQTAEGIDVGDWISEQTHCIEMNAPFEQLPKTLLSADDWLSRMVGDRRLIFSIVGFIGRRPTRVIISNFVDAAGNRYEPAHHKLKVFSSKPKKPQVHVAGDEAAVLPNEAEHLRGILAANRKPSEIHEALAEAIAAASGRSSTISRECVTGHLLPTGAAEIMPHGISDKAEYLPGFVKRNLTASGISGFKCKLDENGKPLPPRWVGMTAKIQGGPKDAVVGVLHSIRNVEGPMSSGIPGAAKVFWKVAGDNEPDQYTFQIQRK